jgi:hypothetical protein
MRTIVKHIPGCNSTEALKCKKHQVVFCSCEAGGLCPDCDMEMKCKPLANHTSLPWKYVSDYDEAYIDGPEPSQKGMINFYLCDTAVGHANAAFIVKAVNCHEELVEALKSVKESLLDIHRDDTLDGCLMVIEDALARGEGKDS